MAITKFLKPQAQSLAENIATIRRNIEVAATKRAPLVSAVEAALLSEENEDRAEQALADHDAHVARLQRRLEANEREEAKALEALERDRVASLEKAARDAGAACAAAAAEYDTRALACAKAAHTLAQAEARLYAANRTAERAGGAVAGGGNVDHVLRDLSLPHSDSGQVPHHSTSVVSPHVIALGERVREVAAQGESKLMQFASGVREIAQNALGR